MVCGATRADIDDAGGPALGESFNVAHLHVFGRDTAAGYQATTVPGQNCLPHICGDKTLLSTDIQNLAFTVEDDGEDPRIAQLPS